MKRVIVWRRLDTTGVEYAQIEADPLRIEGEIVLIEDGARCFAAYRVECDDLAMTTSASIRLHHEGTRRERHLRRDSRGAWTIDGAPAPALEGLADVDLSVTPSTNTPPIRRLGLAVGQRAEVTAAWVRFPALDVVPLRQIVRRLGPSSYRYEAPDLQFSADLECDEGGVVRSYGNLWRECS